MIRIFAIFLLLALLIGIGIHAFRQLNSLEKWKLTKYIVYSMMCSLLALGALTVFVVLF